MELKNFKKYIRFHSDKVEIDLTNGTEDVFVVINRKTNEIEVARMNEEEIVLTESQKLFIYRIVGQRKEKLSKVEFFLSYLDWLESGIKERIESFKSEFDIDEDEDLIKTINEIKFETNVDEIRRISAKFYGKK